MAIYKIMRCSSCGAPIKESEIRKDFCVKESSTDKPNMATHYVFYLCENCAAAFDKALERATKWEMEE